MKKLTSQEIKSIQVDVLQEFHNFCIKHDLKYSLCAGTLLGAIRHKGYIPWDEDIDVMMPRREYQKFIHLYSSDKYMLYTYDTSPSYMLSYAKLSDNRTLKIEDCVYTSDYGVDIDIFPLDFFPDTIKESKEWSRNLGIWKDIRTIKNIKLSKRRSLFKNIIIILSRLILSFIPMKYIVRKVDVLAQKYSYKTNGYLGNMTNGYRMKERNPMAETLIEVEFEGKSFMSVDNYDVYLRGLYGNYMQYPPEDKRKAHHCYNVYWK